MSSTFKSSLFDSYEPEVVSSRSNEFQILTSTSEERGANTGVEKSAPRKLEEEANEVTFSKLSRRAHVVDNTLLEPSLEYASVRAERDLALTRSMAEPSSLSSFRNATASEEEELASVTLPAVPTSDNKVEVIVDVEEQKPIVLKPLGLKGKAAAFPVSTKSQSTKAVTKAVKPKATDSMQDLAIFWIVVAVLVVLFVAFMYMRSLYSTASVSGGSVDLFGPNSPIISYPRF